MIAIHTKYLGPTNSRGGRIKAYTADGRSATISYPHELDGERAHFKAARAFMERHFSYYSRADRMVYGDSADGRGYVFCFPQSLVTLEIA